MANLLQRYSPPRAIAKNGQAQAEEMSSLIKAINRAMPSQDFEEWWQDFEERLLTSHQTRAWPTLHEVSKAFPQKGSGENSTLAESERQIKACEWFNQHGKPHPVFNKPSFTAELLRIGAISDLREARFLGFDLTEDQEKAALKQRMGREEWRYHIRVVARLRDCSEAEAESVERFQISPEQLPTHLAGRAA